MWINLSPNLNPNLSPNPSPNLMSSLLNTCLLPLFSISSRIKLVMIFLFLLVMNILFLVTNILLRIYSRLRYVPKGVEVRPDLIDGKHFFFSLFLQDFFSHLFRNVLASYVSGCVACERSIDCLRQYILSDNIFLFSRIYSCPTIYSYFREYILVRTFLEPFLLEA